MKILTKNWSIWRSCAGSSWLTLTLALALITTGSTATKVSDDLQFNINWAGPQLETDLSSGTDNGELVVMKTENQETYHCTLPSIPNDNADADGGVTGIHPLRLLASLHQEGSKCSYRLEPYWSYEVCHNGHVRQFHEEKDATQQIKLQEFHLGRLSKEDMKNLMTKGADPIGKIRTMRFDNRDTPYYSVVMGNGTKCDLNGQPRKVEIIYICHLASNNEVMSVKEVTSCEYEVVVLTPLLCTNPSFRLKENPVIDIKCRPVEGSPRLPKGLMDHERETFLHNSGLSAEQVLTAMESSPQQGTNIHIDLSEKSFEVKQSVNVNPTSSEETPPAESSYALEIERSPHPIEDSELTRQFLAGEYCLQGGTGWWHYEFCFGRHVSQFHQEPGKRTTVLLGNWNKELHLEWKKSKKRVKTEDSLLLLYSNGDFCELTGRLRSAQVKLKCRRDQEGQSMSIYLVEPAPCTYIVGVESPILCSIIEKANEDGIIPE